MGVVVGGVLVCFWWFSSSALATALAGMSQRKTWHLCFFVTWSRATYPKSLQRKKEREREGERERGEREREREHGGW